MARETQKKGDLAKTQAILYFTSLGYEVGLLITESAAYDLLIDTGIEIKRVQIKYCKGNDVDLRRIHSNSTGYIVKSYENTDFDWLFVYQPSGAIFIIEDAAGKTAISLRSRKAVGVRFNEPLLKSGGNKMSLGSNPKPSSTQYDIR